MSDTHSLGFSRFPGLREALGAPALPEENREEAIVATLRRILNPELALLEHEIPASDLYSGAGPECKLRHPECQANSSSTTSRRALALQVHVNLAAIVAAGFYFWLRKIVRTSVFKVASSTFGCV